MPDNEIISWDWKSILSTVAIIGFIVLLFSLFYIPTCDTRKKDTEYYNSETKGVIYSIEKKTGMSQGRFGNRESTIGYEIDYFYEVNGIRYDNIDYVYSTNLDNSKFIQYANKNINNKVFIVRYVSWKPEESFIVKSID